MKKAIIIGLLFLLTFSNMAFGQSSKGTPDTLQKADDLINKKQYKSGFDLLDKADPENAIPEVVLKKVDLLLNFHAVNTMVQTFGLRDLKNDETIEQIRGEQGVYTYYYLEINNVLEKLIKEYPANWQLYQALGKYYFDIYVNYEDNWFMPGKELLTLAENNYAKADQNGISDGKSIFALGYIYLQNAEYEKAEAYILRYLKLDANNANANYNLAYAYLQLGKTDDSIKYAGIALNTYDNTEDKAGIARFMASVYQNKNDDANAITYYKMSEAFSPNNYYNLKALLELYIKTKDLKSAAMTADALFALKPTDVSTIQEVFRNYYNNDYKDELVAFFSRAESQYAKQDSVMGNISFHEGYYYKFEKDFKREKDYFTEARKYFSKCYKEDYYLFKTIDEELRLLANK